MKRTFIFGLTLLALILVISACAAPVTPAPAPTQAPAQPTQAPAQPTAAPAQPTQAPAAAADEWGTVTVKKGDTIKASFSAAMTGDLALFGQDMQLGAQMAAAKFGSDIDGFKLEIVTEDDLCSGPGGTTIANKIVANPAIVGHIGFMCSSGMIPGSEILDKAHIVSISPSATAVTVTSRGLPTVNRTAFNDKIQGPADANFVLKELGLKKAATMHDGSPYGQGLAEAFAEAFKAGGGQVVGDMEAITVGEKDFRATLTKIAANQPEIIFFGGFWPEAAVLITQKAEVGMKDVKFMSADGTFSADLIKAIPEASQGTYASFGSSQQGAGYSEFVKEYEAKGGKKENIVFSPQTYDAVNVLALALKAVAKPDADGNLTIGRKALADAVRQVKLEGVTGAIAFDANGDRPPESTNVIINQVQGDEWVQVFPPKTTAAAGPDEWGDVVVKKGDTIKASFSAAMTGDLALFGQDMQLGAQMAAAKFGSDIDGFKLEIVTEDDLCSGPGGTTIANKIVANPAIVGHIGFMCSSGMIPGSEILDKAHIVSISPSATAVTVTSRGLPTVNRTAFNDKIQGPADANFVLKELGLKKAATMHDGSPYGQGLAEAFAEAFKAGGGQVVGDMEAITVGEKDFRATLTKIAANQPEIIFFGGFWPEAAVLITQKAEVGMKDVKFMSADGTFSADLIKAIPEASQGTYASFGSSQQGAGYSEFVKEYEAKGGKKENIVFSPQTYDAVNVLALALKAVAKPDADGNLTIGRKALADAVRQVKLEGVTGAIAFDANGDRPPESTNVIINQVQGDEWVQVFPPKTASGAMPDLGGKEITVAVENAYPPFNAIDTATGKGVGWDYDALAEICKRINCKPVFKEIAWDGMLAAISQNQFDMAADGVTITDERAKTVDFSIPYQTVSQVVMTRADETRFKTLAEAKAMKDLKVGTQKGTTNYDEAVKAWGEANVIGFDQFPEAVNALITQQVDIVVADNSFAKQYLTENADKIKIMEEPLLTQYLGFVFPKGSSLVASVNAAIQAMTDDGTIAALEKKWFENQ